MKRPTEEVGFRGDIFYIYTGLAYFFRFKISNFNFFFQKGEYFLGMKLLEYPPHIPMRGMVTPFHPVYPNFQDATQSALIMASAPCPFLILAGALQ